MVLGTLLHLRLVLVALLGDEALPLAPVEYSVDVAATASVVGLVAVNDLLCCQLDLLLRLLAYSVTNDSHYCHSV